MWLPHVPLLTTEGNYAMPKTRALARDATGILSSLARIAWAAVSPASRRGRRGRR